MLKKGISAFGVFSIASGAMISSGIFILPGMAFSTAGPAVFLSYFIAGTIGLLGILSVIELATAMPKAGGDYFFINKTFGPLLGTVTGFLGWAALSLKSAFAIFGISEVLFQYAGINHIFSGLVITLVFVFVNSVGVKKASSFQIILVSFLLLLLIIYMVFGIGQVDPSRFTPFLAEGINPVLVATGFVFITFGGLVKVATLSEEVTNPKRNIPLGIISSIITVTIIYTAITFVITGTLEPEAFESSMTPVADSARLFMGTTGYVIITIASLLAFISTANAGILSAARYPMALSRDQLLPGVFSRVNRKFRTPILAISTTGAFIVLALALPLEVLVTAASAVILAAYVLTNSAVIVLRESQLVNYKPTFKTPFYPWLQICSILIFLFLIFDLGARAIVTTLALVVISLCFYFLYGRKRKKRESALRHLLNRAGAADMTGNILEDELREVIIERDNIRQDVLDELLKDVAIIDIKGPVTAEQAMKRVAGEICDKAGMTEGCMLSWFMLRGTGSNLYVKDFHATHHIVIEDVDQMHLILVRSKEGIFYSETKNAVKALFLLFGPKDERIKTFRVIDAIYEMIEQRDFQENWLNEENHEKLRNLLIFDRDKTL